MKVYQQIASWRNAINGKDAERDALYADWINRLIKEYLPSGSGIDNGVRIDYSRSNGSKILLTSSFHKMNEAGFYCGWWDFSVHVTPSLISEFDMRITSSQKDTMFLRDYLGDVFYESLRAEVSEDFLQKMREELRASIKEKLA